MEQGERFNTSTHLLGTLLALIGGALLITQAAHSGDIWKIVSFSVYAMTLVLLYALSTLYHATRGRIKSLFRRLDHDSIYLLIAGTYTPFSLVSLRGPWGWSIFGTIWTLAVLGIVKEYCLGRKNRGLSLGIYLLMGWIALAALIPLLKAISLAGFVWLLAGGLMYSVGAVFYLFADRYPYFHGIWHLFVIAGSALHYCTVIFYVL